jgi:CHASE3 domain sensor protein
MAYDEIELAMRNHTATSQMLTEMASRGSTKVRLEKQLLEERIKLERAKADALAAQANQESLAADAIEAMRKYTGGSDRDRDA